MTAAAPPNAAAAAALEELRRRGLTLAVAESLTGGALSAALVSVPGASAVLRGAVVAYATPVKASLLGVDPGLLAAHGPVDPEVARQMARGVRPLRVAGRHHVSFPVVTRKIDVPSRANGCGSSTKRYQFSLKMMPIR